MPSAAREWLLPLFVCGVMACYAPLTTILLPAHILELSCHSTAAPCGSDAATEAAGFWLEGSRSFVNFCAMLTLPAFTLVADRWGRKPVLCACVGSMALDACASALAPSLSLVITLHSASGLVGSTWLFIAVACACCVDVMTTEVADRSGAFALIEAAVMTALVVGPLSWGALAQLIGNRLSMLAMSGALVVLLVLMVGLLPETLTPEHRAPPLRGTRALIAATHPAAPLTYLCTSHAVRIVALMMGCLWGAMRAMEYLFVPFASTEFGWGDAHLGAYTTSLSCAMVLSNIILSARSAKRGDAHVLSQIGAGFATFACSLWACISVLPRGRQGVMWAAALPYGMSMFMSPVLRARLSHVVPAGEQARALGCAAAIETVTAVLAPLAAGALLEACEEAGWATSLSYLPSALLFLAIVPLSSLLERNVATTETWRPHALAEPLVSAIDADGASSASGSHDVLSGPHPASETLTAPGTLSQGT
mmetsp:Transcript_25011/g.64549  ORF Transcript_25011/g.64549 Transcript_25011/m.64549 type:complete len:480 (+) Transcript_25011:3-1442(+)